jgi:hypothetical protein
MWGTGETVHMHATDADGAGEWMITMRPDDWTWERGHGKGTAAARGAAADLLLLVYGRLPADCGRFELFGDTALPARWVAKSAR